MSGEPDNLARVFAVLALLLSVAQIVLGARRDLWRRRAGNASGLRVTLEEIRRVLDAADTPRGAANLWTGAVGDG